VLQHFSKSVYNMTILWWRSTVFVVLDEFTYTYCQINWIVSVFRRYYIRNRLYPHWVCYCVVVVLLEAQVPIWFISLFIFMNDVYRFYFYFSVWIRSFLNLFFYTCFFKILFITDFICLFLSSSFIYFYLFIYLVIYFPVNWFNYRSN
jgi:hypothetical protein